MLDEFNLKGLTKYVPDLRKVLYYILNMETSESDDGAEMGENEEEIDKYAKLIYGLIHARYIQTSKGMKQMVPTFYMQHLIVAALPKSALWVMSKSSVRTSAFAANRRVKCSQSIFIEDVLCEMSRRLPAAKS